MAVSLAGRQIIKAWPVYERDLWQRLLGRPLEEIVAVAPATGDVGKTARTCLEWVTETMAKQK
jgi:hypothetical protein